MESIVENLYEKCAGRDGRHVRLRRKAVRRTLPRPERSATELVLWLRQHGCTSTRQLMRIREDGDPTVPDYIKTFGSWNQAKVEAFGPPKPSFIPAPSPDYLVSSALHMGVTSRRSYEKARREHPEVVHSVNQVLKFFGTWSAFMAAVEKRSAEIVIGKYMLLCRRLNRVPTAQEVKKWNIDLSVLRPAFPTKAHLDRLLNLKPGEKLSERPGRVLSDFEQARRRWFGE